MRFFSTLALLILSACSSASDFSLPTITLPEIFSHAPKTHEAQPPQTAASVDGLWQGYGDATLQALMKHALTHNDSIAEARARILEARSLAREAYTALLPSLDAAGKAGTGSRDNPFGEDALDSFEAGVSASFEADLFGKNRAARDAQRAKIRQQRASLADIQRILLSDLAHAYLQLRHAQARITTQKQAIAQARTQRRLSQTREQAGLTSQIDTLVSSRELSQRRAELPALRSLRDEALSRIALLAPNLPEAQQQALRTAAPMPALPVIAVLNTPAALLYARPDVRAAHAELASTHHAWAQAVAAQYPTISLAAFFGWRDNGIAPQGDVWSLGTNLAAPIFNFGRIQSQIDAADARSQQAAARYQRTVRTALSDVERALIAWRDQGSSLRKREQTLALAAQSRNLAQARYDKGLSSYLEVISAQLAWLDAQAATLAANHEALRAATDLYRALGEPK